MTSRIFFAILLSTLFSFLSISSVEATTYYVDADASRASDTNEGSQENPWKTIQHAVSNPVLQPGDTINVMPGTYLERVTIENKSGTKQNPITLKAQNINNKPIVRDPNGANETRNILLKNVSHWVVDGLKVTNFNGIGLSVENDNTPITNIIVKNCEFINGYRDTGHILRVRNGRNGTQKTPATQIKFINNYIENSSPCRVDDPKRCNEIITLLGEVTNTLIYKNTLVNTENIGINTIGKDNNFLNGSPKYIVYDGNIVKNIYKPQNNTPNITTQGLYTDAAQGPILMQNNTVIFDRATKPNEANGLISGVALNAEPSGVDELGNTFKNFIVRNNYFETEFYSFNIGVNQRGDKGQIDRVAIVNNIGINNNSGPNSAGVLSLNGVKNLSFKNNISVKTSGLNQIIRSRTSAVWLAQAYDWGAKMDNEFIPTFEFDGNIYFHPSGDNNSKFNLGTKTYNNFSSYKTQSGLDTNSYFEQPQFINSNEKNLDSHYLRQNKKGVPLTYTVGTGSNSNKIKVRDSKYFFDGYGIEGLMGDKILIGKVQATVVDIDYENTNAELRNTITIDKNISFSDNTPVNYYTNDTLGDPQSRPNIGLIGKEFFDGEPDASPSPSSPVTPSVTPEQCPAFSQGNATCDSGGVIDLTDFTCWKGEFLTGTAPQGCPGGSDFDTSGGVDILDFAIWQVGFASS